MKKHVFSKTYIGLLSFLLFMGFYTEGVAQCSCIDCRCTDSLALVAFYTATGGQNWTAKNNDGQQSPWNLQQLMTTWYGVRLNANGRVECLDLDGANDCQWTVPLPNGLNLNTMNGIPPEIGNLSDLKRVYIGYNPNLKGAIPTTIGRLSKLEKLYLERNGLSGFVPIEMGQLSNLQSLALSVNWNLEGDISNTFSKLRNLTEIYLYTNKFYGNLGWLDSLKSLQYIVLAHNSYEGSIPNLNLPNLKVLDLSENELTGSIPNFQNLTNLVSLALHTNKQLTGNIPNFNLPKLTELFLYNDSLMGNLPNFQYLTNLQVLSLYSNKLTGNIPNFDLPNLKELRIDNNQLNGTIPNFDKMPKLQLLYLSANQLSGNIPAFENLTNLHDIYLPSNRLTGQIPSFNLSNLLLLSLWSNQLSGNIPMFSLPKLEILSLDSNQLSGNVPNFNMPNLREMYIASNQLSGQIPNFNMSNLGAFSTRRNKFTFTGVLSPIVQGTKTPVSFGSYSPQDSIYKDTTITARVTEPLSIDLNIDVTVTTNSYQWYKNGQKFRTPTNSNKLVFDKLLPTDAGVYTCHVTNSLAGALTLYSRKITVVVALTCRYSDSLELVHLYNATNGQNWTNKWNLQQPMTTWYGILTNPTTGCVIRIDLDGVVDWEHTESSGNNLNGVLPSSLNNLCFLEILYLANNRLNGSLIDFNSTNLQVIDLNNNLLNSTIPNFNLPNLVYLYLNHNQLTGTIPNFNRLLKLQSLDLVYNQLSNNIPNFNLPELVFLNLYHNQLTGTIPNFNLPKLKELYLHENQLNGTIPNFNLTELQKLYLSSNKLTDNIPNFNLPNLKYLYLSENQLTGTIPTFNSLINLQYLYLGSNKLTGPIPDFKLPNLLYISLEYNQLTGNIPNFKLPNLIGLNIFSNQLTGTIPDFNLPNAEFINFSYNQVTGSVPNFNFPKLTTLLFSNNRINSVPRFTNLNLQKDNMYQRGLRCQYNVLTFDDILPNINFATTATYIYAPQDSIYKDTTIKIIPNTSLSISLDIDSTVTTNSYQWYKNGKEFGAATSSNTLIINALTFEHAGVYTCTVSNPNAPNLKLYSRPITLTTGRIETTKVETSITPNGDGKNDALDFPDANLEGHPENAIEIYNRWGQLVYKASPYKRDWSGQDLNGQLLPAGDYFFIMRVSIGDGQIIVGSVYLSR